MNIQAIATSRRTIAAAVALMSVGLAGSPASAFGIKTFGTVVYAQAPAPGYYAAAPAAYGQAPYYLVTNHHKKYIVPAAAFAPQAYAPAYAPQAFAPQAYAPQAFAPAASSTYVYQPTTASAPAATYTPIPVAAAPAATTVAAAPSAEDDESETTTPAEFKLSGAVLQTFKDDLRKFYESSTETGGMAKVKALKDEAKNIYSSYDEAAGDVAANSPIDRKLEEIITEIVRRDRERLGQSASGGKTVWLWNGYGWQIGRAPKTDDDQSTPAVQYVAPPTAAYAPTAVPPPQLYYVPAHRTRYLVR